MNKILITLLMVLGCSCMAQMKPVSLEKGDNKISVKLDGQLFTEFVHGEQKPYLYPVIGPTGINMTRNFPIKKGVKGESQDHPWHTSVYYTHGSVNGLDFWNDKSSQQKNCKIVLDKLEKAENVSSEKAVIVATHKWMNGDKLMMSDKTELAFSGDANKRIIDYKITLIASNGDVKLGDTKEGCMAVRMHQKLRVKDRGAKVINSEGVTGKGVWGKPAKWISYYNEIEGEKVGISMLDHKSNMRYPTTWHARDYGLCAANPFGLKYFLKGQKKKGDYVIKSGESLTFQYRIVFHKGSPEDIKINNLHDEFIK